MNVGAARSSQAAAERLLVMVGQLALAHERACEADLAAKLDRLIAADILPDLARLWQQFGPTECRIADVTVLLPSPAIYDALMAPDMAEIFPSRLQP